MKKDELIAELARIRGVLEGTGRTEDRAIAAELYDLQIRVVDAKTIK